MPTHTFEKLTTSKTEKEISTKTYKFTRDFCSNFFTSLVALTPTSPDAIRGAIFAALCLRKIRDAYDSPRASYCYVLHMLCIHNTLNAGVLCNL